MAFLDSAFDPSTYMPSGEDRTLSRRAAQLGLMNPQSEPVPDIAHGSIPGLLGVALSDQLAAARSSMDAKKNDLSAAPTRTDAPAASPGGALMPVPAPPAGAAQAAGGPAPPLPPPVDVGLPPGAMGSATPPPMPPSPAAMVPNQPATATAAAAAPPQDNSLIPKDSLIGRMLGGLNNWRDQNRLTLLAMAGGLAGSQSIGQGLGRAFSAAVPAQQADIRQNQQNATARFLMGKTPGLTYEQAVGIASNPTLMAQILPQLVGAKQKQFTQIGEDMFGNKKYGFVDPVSGTVQPFEGSTPYGGGAAGGGVGGNVDSSLKGEAYLKQFPAEIQDAVRDYHGGLSMPTGNPRAGFTQAVKQIAQKYGNDIGMPADDTTFAARRKMRTDLASSGPTTTGGIISNGKSAFDHLAELSDRYSDVGNFNLNALPSWATTGANAVGNYAASNSEQKARIKAAEDNAIKYGQEATKFYAGSGGGEAERLGALHGVNPSIASSNEMAAFLNTEKGLMLDRLRQKEAQIRDTLGQPYLDRHPVMTPELQKTLNKIDGNIAKLRGQAAPTAEGASTPQPRSKAEYEALPKGATYLAPDGTPRVKQ